MQNELPEWAMEEAAALRSAVVWQSNASNEVIARALVAAERRGIERSAKVAETGYWSSALGSETGSVIAITIRQLGETPHAARE
jgi:hypothetical protein